MELIVGIDTGGTFTDCVVIDDRGQVIQEKAFSTPENFTLGVLQALQHAAEALGQPLEELLHHTRILAHGTTVGLNALVSRRGARVGLITTRGHEEAMLIGRVHQKVAGLSEQEITHAARLSKARPLVPRPLIMGVTERVDYKGTILVPLDQEELATAVAKLLAQEVESVAVSLLWSFLNPSHEQQIKQYLLDIAPQLFVSLSSELVPILGEYERTATTVINAYLGPIIQRYVTPLNRRLKALGLPRPFLTMQSAGGVISCEQAGEQAVQMLFSGPVGGVVGARAMARLLGEDHIITTDVGGTSFDVGLIVGGEAQLARLPVVEQYHVLSSMVDIVSIGAGGGSIAWVEPETGRLGVGPHSAGAQPGPACYDNGGVEPTVTDADLVLGRLNPERFFGGRKQLSRQLAEEAIRSHIAVPLGMDVIEAARGIIAVVDAHMGDLVRRVSLERGFDPRDFVLFAYGGSGPTHVGAYARDAGVRQVVISPFAPVFSALGIATADLVRLYSQSEPMVLPPDLDRLNSTFERLTAAAITDLGAMGMAQRDLVLVYSVDMKYRRQTHEVHVPVPTPPLTTIGFEQVVEGFEQLYERTFGAGTAYRQAGIELTTLRLLATGPIPKPALRKYPLDGEDPQAAYMGQRPVCFAAGFVSTPIYNMEQLRPGNLIQGPAVIEGDATVTVVHPGQMMRVDHYLNMVLSG